MGAPKKWIKALLGSKRSDKLQSLVTHTDKNCFGCTRKIWHQRKDSTEIDSALTEVEGGELSNLRSITNAASLCCTSLQVQNAAQVKRNTREELAAIHIQAAFRGFLARRALRALKGLVKLQAIVRGRAVRKQAAITLHCMQAVVRVQARVQARRASIALENQTTQNALQQHQRQKAHVKEIEDGWCDTIGSVEEIQAKLLKRKEAAAKREKAMSYASAHQRQASSKQKAKPSGIEPDNSHCNQDSSQRWENRALEANLEDGMKLGVTELGHSQVTHPSHSIYSGRKPKPSVGTGRTVRSSSNNLDVSNGRRAAASPYRGCNQSPNKSSNMNEMTTAVSSSRNCKVDRKVPVEEAPRRPNIRTRSQSTPKERITPLNEPQKKRLSLQDNRQGLGAQPARQLSQTSVKRTPALKPGRARRNDWK